MTNELMIRSVLVVGSGPMGWGILRSFAGSGFDTTLLSRNPDRLPPLPEGAHAVDALPTDPPDLIIESIPEIPELKIDFFRRLGKAYGDVPIAASNTSGLPLEDLAAAYGYPHRFVGIHYFHPADVAPLVEVIPVADIDGSVVRRTVAALAKTGKEALVLKRPVAGFLVNRMQHAILHESYYLIEQGIVSAEDVDKVARRLLGPRMCITGLIEQKDLSGLDTHALAQQAIVPHLWHGAEPSRIVQDKYRHGDLGLKTGRGFYDWSGKDPAEVRKTAADRLARLLEFLDKSAT
ncbi:MAG: 3-hydroxyacyl-CoA dehydrogenase NAD-binding domain-containing protein [Deltaproteobacteria bacterium]|nr:3-hydroxyacyl-CoA dehydrogenase NAD-binding domain-containing protein [Deltaproteobacteria bacterium]